MVTIRYDDGVTMTQAHATVVTAIRGQRGVWGDPVGVSGGSGFGSDSYYGPHIHNQANDANGRRFDQLPYMQLGSTSPAGGDVTPFPPSRPKESDMSDTQVIYKDVSGVQTVAIIGSDPTHPFYSKLFIEIQHKPTNQLKVVNGLSSQGVIDVYADKSGTRKVTEDVFDTLKAQAKYRTFAAVDSYLTGARVDLDEAALAVALAPLLAPLLELDGFEQADADALVHRITSAIPSPQQNADATVTEFADRADGLNDGK